MIVDHARSVYGIELSKSARFVISRSSSLSVGLVRYSLIVFVLHYNQLINVTNHTCVLAMAAILHSPPRMRAVKQ